MVTLIIPVFVFSLSAVCIGYMDVHIYLYSEAFDIYITFVPFLTYSFLVSYLFPIASR